MLKSNLDLEYILVILGDPSDVALLASYLELAGADFGNKKISFLSQQLIDKIGPLGNSFEKLELESHPNYILSEYIDSICSVLRADFQTSNPLGCIQDSAIARLMPLWTEVQALIPRQFWFVRILSSPTELSLSFCVHRDRDIPVFAQNLTKNPVKEVKFIFDKLNMEEVALL